VDLFTLVRVLFVPVRDAFERATLEPEEYRRKKREREERGCIGCAILIAVILFLFLLGLSTMRR
jgi:hypothetical protein